jgi:16S rRNA (adenine1518-N6/adenine1519-N6)-dimethyltransferase
LNNYIATPGRTKEILTNYGIRLSRKLGQNFLVDHNIIEIIIKAAEVGGNDIVLEIGPGIGSLTQAILEKLKDGKLIAIEKDDRMIQVLRDLFRGETRLELINRDVLEIDWFSFYRERELLEGELKVLANLPYYITTPIIMSLLESGIRFQGMVFMVQKEVAERMVARSGGKDYGALSVAVQYYAIPEIIHEVSPNVFIPRPEVSSAVIKLTPSEGLTVSPVNEKFFFSIVKALFQQRRKTIKNALSKAVNLTLSNEVVEKSLAEIGLDPRIRGERLSPEEIVRLSNTLWQYLN